MNQFSLSFIYSLLLVLFFLRLLSLSLVFSCFFLLFFSLPWKNRKSEEESCWSFERKKRKKREKETCPVLYLWYYLDGNEMEKKSLKEKGEKVRDSLFDEWEKECERERFLSGVKKKEERIMRRKGSRLNQKFSILNHSPDTWNVLLSFSLLPLLFSLILKTWVSLHVIHSL